MTMKTEWFRELDQSRYFWPRVIEELDKVGLGALIRSQRSRGRQFQGWFNGLVSQVSLGLFLTFARWLQQLCASTFHQKRGFHIMCLLPLHHKVNPSHNLSQLDSPTGPITRLWQEGAGEVNDQHVGLRVGAELSLQAGGRKAASLEDDSGVCIHGPQSREVPEAAGGK